MNLLSYFGKVELEKELFCLLTPKHPLKTKSQLRTAANSHLLGLTIPQSHYI